MKNFLKFSLSLLVLSIVLYGGFIFLTLKAHAGAASVVSAKITSPTQFTVVYTDAQDAVFTNYSALFIDGHVATVDSMTGTGTITHVITFTPNVSFPVTTASTGTTNIAALLGSGASGNDFPGQVDQVLFDGQAPTGDVALSSAVTKIGSTTQTVTVTYGEVMAVTHPTIVFNHGTFVSNADGAWTDTTHYHESFVDSSAEDFPAVTVSTSGATDVALNPEGTSTNGANNPFILDTIAPTTPSAIHIVSSNGTPTLAKVGDTVTITASVDGTTATGTIGGQPTTTNTVVGGVMGATATLTRILDGTETLNESANIIFTLVSTDAVGNNSTTVTNTNIIDGSTVSPDFTLPTAFATGAVLTIGAPVIAGKWNASNTDITVTTPVDSLDSSLDGGTIQIKASRDDGITFVNLGSAYTIITEDITAGTKTLSFTKAQFESLAGFAEGDTWLFEAVISDLPGNITTGDTSFTDIFVDRIAPTTPSAIHIVSSNGTPTLAKVGDTVTITASVDGTTATGTIGGQPTTTNTVVGGVMGATATLTRILDGTETEGPGLNFTLVSTDAAGNSATAVTKLNILDGSAVQTDFTAPSTPTSNVSVGTYSGTQNVSLSSIGSTSIRYTTDGSIPSCTVGSVYSSAISVYSTQTINAKGCDVAGNASALGSFLYTISGISGGGGYFPTPVVSTPIITPVIVPFKIPADCTASTLFSSTTGEPCKKIGLAPGPTTILQKILDALSLVIINPKELLGLAPGPTTVVQSLLDAMSVAPVTQAKATGSAPGPTTVTGLTSSTSSVAPTLLSKVQAINTNIFLGMKGNEQIRAIQQFLISQNKGPAAKALSAHGLTPNFGDLTKAALMEWQNAVGITPATGVFGPATRAKMQELGM